MLAKHKLSASHKISPQKRGGWTRTTATFLKKLCSCGSLDCVTQISAVFIDLTRIAFPCVKLLLLVNHVKLLWCHPKNNVHMCHLPKAFSCTVGGIHTPVKKDNKKWPINLSPLVLVRHFDHAHCQPNVVGNGVSNIPLFQQFGQLF